MIPHLVGSGGTVPVQSCAHKALLKREGGTRKETKWSGLESLMGICELSCGCLAPAVQAKTLGLGFPPCLGLENFILLRLVRSPRPCIARAAQMILKSVGSEEELGCGGVSDGRERNKGRDVGK